MSVLVPAVIPKSVEDIFAVAKRIEFFTQELQIDVVDGVFVDNVSWPYVKGSNGRHQDIRTLAENFQIEMDLMIHNPLEEIPRWIEVGAKKIVVHIESCSDLGEARRLCDEAGVALGVSASQSTDMSVFREALNYGHYAQCMGISRIGVQGEPFDRSVLERIRIIRTQFPTMTVSVDGSINKSTIREVFEAGATRFIAGSAILGSTDAEAAYKELLSLITS